MSLLLAALHMSAFGTKRTFLSANARSAYDPTRTSNSVSCCRSEPGFCPTKALG
jgi:hypothetical protein